MKKLLLAILLFSMCSIVGCKHIEYIEKEVPVEIEKIKTEYINKVSLDSVYLHDSVEVYIKGDTVYKDRWHYSKIVSLSRDTVLVADTVPKVITVTKTEVKEINKLTWYLEALELIGLISLILLIIYLVLKFKK